MNELVRNNKTKKRPLTKSQKKLKKSFYLTLLIVMVILSSITVIYAHLSNLDKKIITQQNEISELKKTKMSLLGEVKGIKSSSQIQDEAIYKLGMVYPKEDQIVYVDLSKEEKHKDVNNNVFLSPIVSVLKSFTKN